ncbi:MAG: SpaA isopeptide-forming pilin-related protein [Peptococcaceae bacterium]
MRLTKQGKTKKHITILLVLAMLLTIMPMSVFAEGDGGSEPTPEVATPITLIGETETIIEKAGLFDVTAQFTTAGMVQWTIGDVTQGEAVATTETTLEDETVVYTTTLAGVTLAAEQTITATLTPTDGTESVTATGTVAKETEIAETTVAMIGDEQYETLNTAYTVAKNSVQPVEIKLLDNVTSDFLFMNNENSDITLDLNGNTLSIGRTYTKDEWYSEGFGVGGKLTFKNGNIVSEEQIASGETFTIKTTGTLNFENCNVLIGGNETYTAIYNEGIVNINGGNFKVLNTSGTGDAFYSDYKTTEINITNANIEIDNTSRFIVNSKSNIDNSTISVKNLRAIGMNESDTVMKKSVLKMNKVNNHGFTNGTLHMYDSTMELNECGNIGVNLDGNSLIDNSTLTIQNCGGIETSGRSALVVKLSTDPSSVLFKIQNNSNLIVENNKQGGIYVSGLLSQDETSNVSVIQNELTVTGKYNTGKGGGISNIGNVCLNKNAKVYNNHATVAGDDIYNADNATITFGATGDDWVLDGDEDGLDCNSEAHAIDGWYDDSESNRWNAHEPTYHTDKLAEDTTMPITGLKALKAAHGLNFVINKVDEKSSLITTDAAKFVLTKEAGNVGEKQTVYYQETNGTINWVPNQDEATELITSNGSVTVTNLPEGDYSIVEIEAPTGYQLAEKAMPITIDYEKNNPMVVNFVNKVEQGAIEGYIFEDVADAEKDIARDNIYVETDDKALSGISVMLYKMQADGKTYKFAGETTTSENGYYKFDNLIPDSEYFVYVERPAAYNRNCAYAYTDTKTNGHRFKTSDMVTGENGNALYCSDIITVVANETACANAGFYYASSGGGGSTTDPDPDKPTVDIPDPDVPLTEPDVPEEPIIDIDEPEVPLTDVPGEEVELDEPEVPLGDAPKTGDAAPVVGLVGLMVAAVIGLAITRRKLN